jgi:Fur family transcriptional regulator, peroxide stress response regulator
MEDDKNIRNTKQRKELLELLCSTESHPNAFWLYEKMKPSFPSLSLSTVYRNLGILEKEGLLLRLPCMSFDRYDGNTAIHSHFYCRKCERVYDLEEDNIKNSMLEHVSGKHAVEGCNVIFYGVCENCKLKNNQEVSK